MPAPVLQFKRGNAGVAGTVPALRPGEPAISLNNFDFFIGIDTSVANNKFFGSHRYWGREDGTTALRLKLVDKTGIGGTIQLKADDNHTGVTTYTFPSTPTDGYFLKTNSSGILSWDQVVSDINIAADTGTPDSVNTGETITFVGGSNLNTVVSNNTITTNLDDSISISGIGTFTTGLVADSVRLGIGGNGVVDTTSGPLYLDSASGNTIINDHLDVLGDIDVQGNVYIGGTTVTLRGEEVFIENKDIVLGYTTSITPNEDTANHAGVAIASTVGSPLVPFTASGINTLPDTYKQMMWFRTGTLGFATDAFAFNYGVAIGTTQMADGLRLKVGSGITMTDTAISATTFYGALSGSITGNAASADQVKTVTASDTNATYYVTFVDANNGSATNETVYTDDGIYYNPGTNTFTTQNALFTGNVTVQGTLTGTATTATRATQVDTTGTSTNADYYVTFVDTLAGETSETLRVGLGLSVNPSNGDVKTTGKLSVGNPGDLTSFIKAGGGSDAMYLYANGDVSFQQKVIVGGLRSSSNSNNTLTLNDLDASFARNLTIAGIATVGTSLSAPTLKTGAIESSTGSASLTIATDGKVISSSDLTVQGNLYVNGNTTQVNTSELTVYDRTITLGIQTGTTPSTTTWDLGVLMNYGDAGVAKTAGVIWEYGNERFVFSANSDNPASSSTSTPNITVSTFAPIEIGALWVNDCAGQSQVISCTGTERFLENVTVDAGTF